MMPHEPAPATSADAGERTVGIADLALALARHKRLVAVPTAAAFLVSLATAFLLPATYRATAKVLAPQRGQEPLSSLLGEGAGGVPDFAAGMLGGGTATDLYVSLAQSAPVKQAIVERFRLREKFGASSWQVVEAALDERVRVTAGAKDGIISLSVTDEDPKRAADMANAFVEQLRRLGEKLDADQATDTRAFYERRLAEEKAELALAEDRLKGFQARRKVIEVPGQAQAALGELGELRATRAAQEVQLATARRTLTDSHQDVKNLKASLEKLTSQITTLEGTKGQGAIPALGAVPSLGQEYARLVRDLKTQEALVAVLAKQYETADLLESRGSARLRVIEPARAPDRRSGPNRRAIVLLSTLVVFAGSLPLAFLAEYAASAAEAEREKWAEIRRRFGFSRRARQP